MDAHKKSAFLNVLKIGTTMFITMGLGLILRLAMPRIFGVENIGAFYTAEGLASLFLCILPLGFKTYIEKHVPGHPEELKDYFGMMLIFQAFFGVCLVAIMVASFSFMGLSERTQNVALAITGFLAARRMFKGTLSPAFICLDRTNLISVVTVVSKVIQVGAISASLYLAPDLLTVAFLFSVTELLPCLYLMFCARRIGFLRFNWDFIKLRNIILVSFPFLMNGMITELFGIIDINILTKLSSEYEVGLYGSAGRIMGVFLMLIPIMQSGVMPVMSRVYSQKHHEFEAFLQDLFRLILLICFCFILTCSFFPEEIIVLISGAEFAPAAPILEIMAFGIVSTSISTIVVMTLVLETDGKAIMHALAVVLGLNALGNWVFIPYGANAFGIGGPGMVVAMTSLAGQCLFVGWGFYRIEERLLTPMNLWRLVGIIVPAGALLVFYQEVNSLSFAQRLIGLVGFVVVGSLVFRLILKSDVQTVQRLVAARLKN